jgi:hypothetical protein
LVKVDAHDTTDVRTNFYPLLDFGEGDVLRLSTVDVELRDLIDKSRQALSECRKDVVPSSMPILFFGDLACYKASKGLKVVTVGLNPSRDEFPKGKRFSRFPLMRGWSRQRFNHDKYVQSLASYFEGDYYRGYFDDFEDVLQAFGVSYRHRNGHGRALHTDFCSPFASRNLWGELSNAAQMKFKKRGVPLWQGVIKYLKPDVMLSTIAFKKHLAPEIHGPWRKRTIRIGVQKYKVYWFNAGLSRIANIEHVINGRLMMRRVLGNLSSDGRKQLGRIIYRLVMK